MSTSTTTQFTSYVTSATTSTPAPSKSLSKILKSSVHKSKNSITTFCIFLTAKIFFGKSNFDFLDISIKNVSMTDEEIMDELTF
jgi:hypothetical protein